MACGNIEDSQSPPHSVDGKLHRLHENEIQFEKQKKQNELGVYLIFSASKMSICQTLLTSA
jgi:hypothetical protein